ncbi:MULTISPECIES: hypothetical protein [Protofrankia]|uniref:Putative secreted protein n=1 Tax=Candidatus Protofrankia datiscae TaxID=2716812 RepID=F8B5S0_9ACTN|nr:MULTISPECIES: hypothetical protein [Protofrankia]AEH10158.1 putative secreted protein [Candidatus Protofrankia datiscae]
MIPVRRVVAGLRARSATTPGLLRLLSAGLLGATLLLWLTAFGTGLSRADAIDTVRNDAGPSFVAAQRIHADLSVADATVARAFLAGGVEPVAQRRVYEESVASASRRVVDLARTGGPLEAREPLTTLAREIPTYTGLVERARTNNRLGNVVGAAYLRQASTLMQYTILPAADALAAVDAGRIDASYDRATAWYHPVLVALAGLACLAGLVAVQVLLYRRTNRVFNLPLVAATALVAGVLGYTLSAFAAERSALRDGRDDAFQPMTLVAQARGLGLRAWGDESLALIARGNGTLFDQDAVRVTQRLGYDESGRALNDAPAAGTTSGGATADEALGPPVLPAVAAAGGPDAQPRAGLAGAWEQYQKTSVQVRAGAAQPGGFQQAVKLALTDGTATFGRYDRTADAALTASERRFAATLADASDDLAPVAVAATVVLVGATALTIAGFQVRINEYRRA